MASLQRLLAEFPLVPSQDRRGLLLSIGRNAKATLTMGDFGAEPNGEEAFVVDLDDQVHVARREAGLFLAARTLGMEVYDPQLVQDENGGLDGYCVLYEMDGALRTLAKGETAAEAQANACTYLEQLVGTIVISIPDWVAGQLHKGFDGAAARPARKRREVVLGKIGTVTFTGKWLAAGVYRWEQDGQWEPTESKSDEVMRALAAGGSLTKVEATKKREVPRYKLRMAQIDGEWFAEHHDLVTAARAGVFLEGVHPWPNVNANDFVVGRNFQRYMREHGWRQPWREESTSGSLKLHGRHWLRDQPIKML